MRLMLIPKTSNRFASMFSVLHCLVVLQHLFGLHPVRIISCQFLAMS